MAGTTIFSAACIWLAAVLDSLCFTVVIPTAEHYMRDLGMPKVVTGLMVSLSPLGKALFVLPSGWFVQRNGLKAYFTLTCACQCLGSSLYAVAGLLKWWEMALAGRLLAGSLGGQLLVSAFVAYGAGGTAAMMLMQSGQVAAYSLGPLLGGLFSWACEKAPWLSTGQIQVCGDTAPGWFLCAFSLLLGASVLIGFVEPPPAGVGQACLKPQALKRVGFWIALFAVFIVQVLVGSWELYTTTMAQRLWQCSIFASSGLVAGLLSIALPLLLVGGAVSRSGRVGDGAATQGLTVLFLPASFLFLVSHTRKAAYVAGSLLLVAFTQLVAALAKALCQDKDLVPAAMQDTAAVAVAVASALGRAAGPWIAMLEASDWGKAMVSVMLVQNLLLGLGGSELRPRRDADAAGQGQQAPACPAARGREEEEEEAPRPAASSAGLLPPQPAAAQRSLLAVV